MEDCDDLMDQLNAERAEQIALAMTAKAAPIVSMHIDLAVFAAEQLRVAEQLCSE